MAIGFGALSAAALPPVFALPVLWISVPGLLRLIGRAPGWRGAARAGFWFGFGLNLFGFYWITEALLFAVDRFWWLVPFAVPLLAVALGVFTAVPCAIAWCARPGWRRVLALAGAWTLSNLVQQFAFTGFPWNLWGGDWAIPGHLGDIFIQPAAWVSVHGLTLATLVLAGLPALGWRGFAGAVAGVLVWGGAGLARLSGPAPAPQKLNVVIAQGDIPEGQKFDRTFALATFNRYLRLTHEGVLRAGAGPVAVIWPETASPFFLQTDEAARAAIARAAEPGVPVLAGTVRFDRHGRPRNSLVAVTGPGPVAAVYDKWHLVPFGEYQPKWLPLPVQVVPGGGFSAGPGPKTLHVLGLPPFGALICYEAIFPGQIIAPHDRPDWLVNVTNDAWFGNSAGPRQHLAAARMRAVEEGLPLVRAANTGISAVFDARGHETGHLGLDRRGVLIRALPGALPPTLFARFGLPIPALLAFLALLAGLVRRRRKPGQEPPAVIS
ncbi:MAG TPA: apolipoprotein N-acyltransferase [Acetobacteraceae bacterium]|nr:apolipoprotein N-acyltransferase [Acetobacteraceae bacterium]